MKLLTKSLEAKLIKNFRENQIRINDDGNTIDFKPVVKFFNPCGSATWLLSELDPENNIMFGLCDLGQGYPELGDVSLDELKSVKVAYGLSIERDLHFKATKTLSQYADDARNVGYIIA